MPTQQVTKPQARIVMNKLAPPLNYLTRLRRRMGARGFMQDDPTFALVQNAELAMQRLFNDLQACDRIELKIVDEPAPPLVVDVESPRTVEMRERMKRDRRFS